MTKTFDDVVKTACALTGEPAPNQDPKTGVCYGIISPNHERLIPEAVDDIYHNGRDLIFGQWYDDAKAALKDLIERYWIPGMEDDPEESRAMLANFFKRDLETIDALRGCDADELAEWVVEDDGDAVKVAEEMADHMAEHYDTCGDAVMYYTEGDEDDPDLAVQIDSLGLWVFKSRFVTLCGGCSPCAPNAGDLTNQPGSKLTYCLPPDWFEDDKPPYPVWKLDSSGMSADELVYMPTKLFDDYKPELAKSFGGCCIYCGTELDLSEAGPDAPIWTDPVCQNPDCQEELRVDKERG